MEPEMTTACVRLFLIICIASLSFSALAQTSAAQIVEQARERARQLDEIKQVLNDPDQNVRLAAFEAMVDSGDPLMRELALDAGIASTDQVLRGLALKYAVLSLEQLNLSLILDPGAPKEVQEKSRAYLEKTGSSFVLKIDTKSVDVARGYFHLPGNSNRTGNISGLVLTFDYGYHTGELHLQDDNTLAGTVYYSYGGNHQFKASAPIR